MTALSRATLIHTPRGSKSVSWLLGDLSLLRLESHSHPSLAVTLRHSSQIRIPNRHPPFSARTPTPMPTRAQAA